MVRAVRVELTWYPRSGRGSLPISSHSDINLVGVAGFEPAASWLQIRPSTKLTIYPEKCWEITKTETKLASSHLQSNRTINSFYQNEVSVFYATTLVLSSSFELPTPTLVKVSGLTAFSPLPVYQFPAREQIINIGARGGTRTPTPKDLILSQARLPLRHSGLFLLRMTVRTKKL